MKSADSLTPLGSYWLSASFPQSGHALFSLTAPPLWHVNTYRASRKEAERAIEEACLARFGTLRPTGGTPVVRSDNGLIFQSRRFRAACRDYRLTQEFITPYTPEQNGIIERFFRSLKEECVWQHRFKNFIEAKAAIRQWIEWYNAGRPHQALGYRSPSEFRAQHQLSVA
jgi:putative transposase